MGAPGWDVTWAPSGHLGGATGQVKRTNDNMRCGKVMDGVMEFVWILFISFIESSILGCGRFGSEHVDISFVFVMPSGTRA